jgi:hypothetical protein
MYLESVRADRADTGDAGALPDATHPGVQLLAREYHLHLSRPGGILHTYSSIELKRLIIFTHLIIRSVIVQAKNICTL